MINERLTKLREILPSKSSAILIFDDANRYYFGKFMSSFGALLVTRERAFHLLDGRYFDAATAEATSEEIEFILIKDLRKQLVNFSKDLNLTKIFLEPTVTVEQLESLAKTLRNCEIKPLAKLKNAIACQRKVKNEFEIDCIKTAQAITDKAFEKILKIIKPGMTELDLAAEIDYNFRRLGSQKAAFETIIAAGKNSANPHHAPTNYKLKSGDAVLMDFGATYKNYCSDMTRTVFLGSVSDEQKTAYNAVLAAQTEAINALKSDIFAKDIDLVTRNFLKAKNLEKYFLHGTGHGAGIDIHENPFLGKKSSEKLQSGMVVTVEPGVYIANEFGIRIEDMLRICENSAENLTNSPKNLIII